MISFFPIILYPLRRTKFFNWINLINNINHFSCYNFNSNAKFYLFVSISVWIRYIFFCPSISYIDPVSIRIHLKCLFHSFKNGFYFSWIFKFYWYSIQAKFVSMHRINSPFSGRRLHCVNSVLKKQ